MMAIPTNISSACVSTVINLCGTRTAMRASAFPTEDPQKLKTPADIMPLYLWLMGDDSRHKTGMTFDPTGP